MTMTDPIADMLTRIRNAIQSKAASVEMPSSKLKIEIAKILKSEGFIAGYRARDDQGVSVLRIELKYTETGDPVIQGIDRVSRPGRRVVLKGPFATKADVKRVIDREESLFRSTIPQKIDLYETLLKTVNRSLGIADQ